MSKRQTATNLFFCTDGRIGLHQSRGHGVFTITLAVILPIAIGERFTHFLEKAALGQIPSSTVLRVVALRLPEFCNWLCLLHCTLLTLWAGSVIRQPRDGGTTNRRYGTKPDFTMAKPDGFGVSPRSGGSVTVVNALCSPIAEHL